MKIIFGLKEGGIDIFVVEIGDKRICITKNEDIEDLIKKLEPTEEQKEYILKKYQEWYMEYANV